ncbi:phosphotransferase [Polaromonas sp.]|nr:phosphotransferase [Polaromonas sp.]
MCLLERVTAWDDQQIYCEANSHRAPDNPLRAFGRLGAACGVEYAAQAMAVHGALVTEARTDDTHSTSPKSGYLASIRSLTLHVQRLDQIEELLLIHAERLSGDEHTILYRFSLHAGTALLVSGRAVVVLDAMGLPLPLSTRTNPSLNPLAAITAPHNS